MRTKLPLIYLAGPYSINPKEMYSLHAQLCAELLLQGKMVYSPIVHCHPLAEMFNIPITHDWKSYNFNTLIRCDELYVINIPDLSSSLGTQNEIAIAIENNIPITYITSIA